MSHPWEALPDCETHEYVNPLGESVRFLTLKGTAGRFMPPMVVTTIPIPAGHGSRYQATFHAERAVALPVAAPAIFDGREDLRRWAKVLDPAKGEGTLTVVQGEWAGRRLRCVYEAGLDELVETSGSFANPATLIFRAAWPYWEDTVEYTVEVVQDDYEVLWFPFPPLSFTPTDAFSVFLANNSGDVDAWPLITVEGPATDVTLTNYTTGEFWHLTDTIGPGEVAILDHHPRHRSVEVDGVNAFDRLTTDSTLWALTAAVNYGINQIEVQAFDTDPTTLITVTWRQQWLGA